MTNLPTAGVDYHVPFGGTRKASYGPREQGFAAIEFYPQVKSPLLLGLKNMTSATYPSSPGRLVVVTGGGSGIGEEIVVVDSCARRRACTSSMSRQSESHALVARPQQRHAIHPMRSHRPRGVPDDARRHRSPGGPGQRAGEQCGERRSPRFEDVTPAYWEQRITVNLRHLFFAAQASCPRHAAARAAGPIINLGSVSWHLALPELVLL